MKTWALIAFILSSTTCVYANDYLSSSDMVQSKNEMIKELARSITINENTALKKSRAIHAWVVNNISYDQYAAEKRISGQVDDSKQDALYVLTSKIAVCEGYADLVAALHRAVGIPATVTVGKFYYFAAKLYPTLKKINHLPDVGSVKYYHAWNEIQIDGKWIPMDSTSDSGYSGGSAWIRSPTLDEEFFNPDIEYFNATHLKTEIFDR